MNNMSFELWWQDLERLAEIEEVVLPEREDCRTYYEDQYSTEECLKDIQCKDSFDLEYGVDWEESLNQEDEV